MLKYYIESSVIEAGVLHLILKSRYQDQIVYFTPGQYVCISFKRNGRKSPFRCFSVTSIPGSNILELGIRIGGDFTKALSKLPRGTEIEVLGPYGDFVVDKDQDEYLVFIAGGIGITPYMSIIRTLLETKYRIPILLLYSSNYSSAMPYIDELISLSKKYSNFTLIPFITLKEDKKLDIRIVNGIIEKSHIEKIVKKDYLTNTYFICGPKLFTTNIVSYLEGLGISEERIITESFSESSQIRTISGKSISKLTYLASGVLVGLGVLAIGILDLFRYVPNHLPKVSTPSTNSSATNSSGNGSNTATLNDTNNYQAPISRSS
jgi:ferredoxin-NADP reductase